MKSIKKIVAICSISLISASAFAVPGACPEANTITIVPSSVAGGYTVIAPENYTVEQHTTQFRINYVGFLGSRFMTNTSTGLSRFQVNQTGVECRYGAENEDGSVTYVFSLFDTTSTNQFFSILPVKQRWWKPDDSLLNSGSNTRKWRCDQGESSIYSPNPCQMTQL